MATSLGAFKGRDLEADEILKLAQQLNIEDSLKRGGKRAVQVGARSSESSRLSGPGSHVQHPLFPPPQQHHRLTLQQQQQQQQQHVGYASNSPTAAAAEAPIIVGAWDHARQQGVEGGGGDVGGGVGGRKGVSELPQLPEKPADAALLALLLPRMPQKDRGFRRPRVLPGMPVRDGSGAGRRGQLPDGRERVSHHRGDQRNARAVRQLPVVPRLLLLRDLRRGPVCPVQRGAARVPVLGKEAALHPARDQRGEAAEGAAVPVPPRREAPLPQRHEPAADMPRLHPGRGARARPVRDGGGGGAPDEEGPPGADHKVKGDPPHAGGAARDPRAADPKAAEAYQQSVRRLNERAEELTASLKEQQHQALAEGASVRDAKVSRLLKQGVEIGGVAAALEDCVDLHRTALASASDFEVLRLHGAMLGLVAAAARV
eukprot:CAMPEP_0172066240 /NCGR_PEP_ID=MMETSP1043-20130122/11057_1 /TAXON_ID=464988 /ORGANISM="Hemiselmis andersenii, Strain CCMP441" /LENGTH=429 /DNA_ID=CAMNT_0012726389 /DNA_START=20 /DNA_END=1306 /DNA_ORIENTATION=+